MILYNMDFGYQMKTWAVHGNHHHHHHTKGARESGEEVSGLIAQVMA